MTSERDSFEDLYLAAPFGYLSTDLDGTITQVNETLAGWLGTPRAALIGTDFGDLLDTGSRLFYETRSRPVLHLKGKVTEVALTMQRGDGTPLAVLANSIVVTDADRQVGVRTALLDASERQQYERTLLDARRRAEASESRLRVLQTSAAGFIAAATVQDVADQLAARATEAFDATTVSVFLADANGVLQPVAGTLRPVNPGGPASLVFASGVPISIYDPESAAQEYPQYAEQMRTDRIDAFSTVPLIHDGETLGVMLCTFARARTLDPPAVELQAALTLQASQVLVRLRLQAELERMARHDPLTGLANRQLLHERAEQALASARRTGRPLALIFFDLDGFKTVNDTLGHTAGDTVLREVAARLGSVVRATDFSARFGGDEFVVVCEDTDAADAERIAERIRVVVAQPLAGIDASVGASIGVAAVTAGNSTLGIDELLELADAAMYRSKNAGRNRVTVDVIG